MPCVVSLERWEEGWPRTAEPQSSLFSSHRWCGSGQGGGKNKPSKREEDSIISKASASEVPVFQAFLLLFPSSSQGLSLSWLRRTIGTQQFGWLWTASQREQTGSDLTTTLVCEPRCPAPQAAACTLCVSAGSWLFHLLLHPTGAGSLQTTFPRLP